MAQEVFRIGGSGLTVGNVSIVNAAGQIVAESLANRLSQLTDVDFNALVDDGLLMYNAGTGKWIVTKALYNHHIDAGQY